MLSRLFRHRRIRRIFPIGCVAAFLAGIVGAPMAGLYSGVVGTLVIGGALGLIGTAGLFVVLRYYDERL